MYKCVGDLHTRTENWSKTLRATERWIKDSHTEDSHTRDSHTRKKRSRTLLVGLHLTSQDTMGLVTCCDCLLYMCSLSPSIAPNGLVWFSV